MLHRLRHCARLAASQTADIVHPDLGADKAAFHAFKLNRDIAVIAVVFNAAHDTLYIDLTMPDDGAAQIIVVYRLQPVPRADELFIAANVEIFKMHCHRKWQQCLHTDQGVFIHAKRIADVQHALEIRPVNRQHQPPDAFAAVDVAAVVFNRCNYTVLRRVVSELLAGPDYNRQVAVVVFDDVFRGCARVAAQVVPDYLDAQLMGYVDMGLDPLDLSFVFTGAYVERVAGQAFGVDAD